MPKASHRQAATGSAVTAATAPLANSIASSRSPWRVHQNYLRDIALIRRGDLEAGMEFASGAVAAMRPERVAA